jgi:hypothetical protein
VVTIDLQQDAQAVVARLQGAVREYAAKHQTPSTAKSHTPYHPEFAMSWYTAHAIMFVRFKEGRQEHYPVWENVLLIRAASEEEAFTRACERAKQDEGDSNDTFTGKAGRPSGSSRAFGN